MSKDLDNRYFIILNEDKIIFSCLNNQNKISFTKSHILINGLNNLFEDLEKFFIENLIDIEKSLKDFIKKIYIIFDIDNSLSSHLSIKYKLEAEKINENKINELLTYLKNQFNKYSNDQKVIHMTVIRVLIDGKEKDLSLIRETADNLIKKLCSNYQISIEKILLANHLRHSYLHQTDNIVFSANKFLNGTSNNEVFWTTKKPIKHGFFEKFFNFFN